MLRQPSETDARELLLESGIRFRDMGEYFSLACPFHSDRHPSAALYKDRWLFKCFSCGISYSFPKFYEALKGKLWDEHGAFSMVPVPAGDTLADSYRETFAIEEGRVTSVYDNAKALDYCRSRGVSDEFMRFFEFQASDLCKFKKADKDDPVSIWRDRLLIPINLEGKPYSLEGRDYTRGQKPKCLYPKRCKTDICFNQDNLDRSGTLIVCEGIMDIHKIWSSADKNVTCTFGVSLSDGQKEFLCGVQNLVLFIDDDPAGHGSVSAFEKFMKYDFKVAVVPGTDPGGASIDRIYNALANAVSWADFLVDDTKLFDKPVKSAFSLSGL
ncbi:MAG: hypothetical protein LBK66_03130 [Spirochaetaceae bacterium]|jgi:DNA primase|nr:hypothetical protein [Spirochaetaceae bacterium]